jgi:hypothetical protein
MSKVQRTHSSHKNIIEIFQRFNNIPSNYLYSPVIVQYALEIATAWPLQILQPPAGSPRDVHVGGFFANGSWGWTCRRPLHHLGISPNAVAVDVGNFHRLGPNRDKQVQLWRRLIRRLAYWLYKEKSSNTLLKKKLCSSFMSFVVLLTTAEVQLHPRAMKHHDSWSANRIESEKGLCILNYVKLHVQSCSYHLSVFESFGIALELLNPLHTVILRQRSRAVRASSERGSLQQQIPQLRTGNKLMEHNSVANVKLNCLRCVSSFHA